MIGVIDFGSQYTQLIARRFREMGVYSEIFPPTVKFSELKSKDVEGIVLSGGPNSVYNFDLNFDMNIFSGEVPVLGICFGFQLMAQILGGKVEKGEKGEFGLTKIRIVKSSLLFKGLAEEENVWMSHHDVVKELPSSFEVLAYSENNYIAAAQSQIKPLYLPL